MPGVAGRHGQQREDLVTVDDLAGSVDGQAAISVAIERETGVGAVGHDGCLQILQVRRPAVTVDVQAIRLSMDGDDGGTQMRERLRPDLEGSTVGAIEHDGESVESLRHGVDQVLGVRGDAGVTVADPSHVGTDGPVPRLLETLLDLALELVVELEPAAGQELDAVVRHRIVARRDHDAHVGCQQGGQVRRAGGGHHAKTVHVDTCRREASDHGRLEELTRGARITTHHRGGTSIGERPDLTEDVGGRHRQVDGNLGRQIAIGDPANTVGAEDPTHRTRSFADQRLLY